MNWLALVKEEAAKAGKPVPSDEDADYILWEYTGFPSFFTGTPEECCRKQLAAFFVGDVPSEAP